ncbi:S-adenosylmethionine:tRNA ribosyltransferase-isomerase [Minicystis rosea]|nr:S-adenosylmethionine:tRNA ribosyltransferase-isomerase [Minicystis rosea]
MGGGVVSPATWPREDPLSERLLWIDPRAGTLRDGHVRDLPELLRAGDLLVVNDSATLPASLRGVTGNGAPVEARLAGAGEGDDVFRAVLFGAGDHRTRTEDRAPPPVLFAGDRIAFGPGLAATIARVSPISSRLVDLAFDTKGAALWTALYRQGRPVQYAYVAAPLELWHTQTRYGSRPWSAEMPSAGRPLGWSLILEAIRRGVTIARLTHAAGLSSTGDPLLDAALPLPERFDIPEETVRAIAETRARGGRVIAVGTTVARALEGSAALHDGTVMAGEGVTDLVLDHTSRPRVVDGLLTGMHEPTASHFHLLEAFASPALLRRAHAHAEEIGYLGHEFGDSTLVLPA